MQSGTLMISPNYSRNDYLDLVLEDPADWDRAIDIFNDRIGEQYFRQIRVLLMDDPRQNAFAAMALNCLLTEALLQFRDGLSDTGGKVAKLYERFIMEEFSDIFPNKYVAKKFYKGVRCGLLHGAQTNEDTCLTCDTENKAVFIADNRLFVSVPQYTGMLEDYYNRYVERLRSRSDPVLVDKFIRKMDYLCNGRGFNQERERNGRWL